MYGDAPLSSRALVQILATIWSVRAQNVEYERVGFGSYHWRTVTQDGAQWFVTADQAVTGKPVVQAYELARRLADDGLEFVRAKQPIHGARFMVHPSKGAQRRPAPDPWTLFFVQ